MGLFWWRVSMAIDSIAMTLDNAIGSAKDTCDDLKDFAKETKEDFKEFGEIIAEGAVDLAETAVADGIDYTEQKIDRYFENWEAILSDDPYTDGKIEGYNKAAEHFELLYRELQDQRKNLLQAAKQQNEFLSDKASNLNRLLEELKKQSENARKVRDEQIENVAKAKKLSIHDVSNFSVRPKNSNLLDLIASKKLREMKRGELDGFEEAKRLYKKKFDEENKIFQSRLKEYYEISEQMIIVIDKINNDISSVNSQIVTLDILE